MIEILVRFLTVQPLNEHPIIPWGLAVIWVVLTINCIFSIIHLIKGNIARVAWIMIVVLVPLLGMAVYLVYCLTRADYSFLKFLIGPPKRHVSGHSSLKLPSKSR